MIQALIDKQDTAEQVRDQIAAILAQEVASQMQLATDEGKDPELWNLKVYTERSNPWESFRAGTVTPIVNVWWDDETFDKSATSAVLRQDAVANFNIDVYGYGKSGPDGDGHKAGDEEANRECQRAVRLVRNIIMATDYRYLALQGLVGLRWFTNIKTFQPQQDVNAVENITAARMTLEVRFSEFAPEYEGQPLEIVFMEAFRAEDGSLYFELEFDNS